MSQEVFEFAKDITRTTQHSNCKKDTTCLTKKIYHLVVTIQCIFMSHKNHLVNPHLYYSFLFPGVLGVQGGFPEPIVKKVELWGPLNESFRTSSSS